MPCPLNHKIGSVAAATNAPFVFYFELCTLHSELLLWQLWQQQTVFPPLRAKRMPPPPPIAKTTNSPIRRRRAKPCRQFRFCLYSELCTLLDSSGNPGGTLS